MFTVLKLLASAGVTSCIKHIHFAAQSNTRQFSQVVAFTLHI